MRCQQHERGEHVLLLLVVYQLKPRPLADVPWPMPAMNSLSSS